MRRAALALRDEARCCVNRILSFVVAWLLANSRCLGCAGRTLCLQLPERTIIKSSTVLQ